MDVRHKNPEKLIDNLVQELKPVADHSRILPPVLGWGAMFVTLVLLSLAVASRMASGRTWSAYLLDPSFFLALIPAVPAAVWAILLSLPGRRTRRWEGLTAASFGLWGLYLIADIFWKSQAHLMLVWQGRYCILDIMIMAFFPLLLLISSIRKRFVLNRDSAIVALFLSSSLVGAACAGILCEDHSSAHVFQEHFLPVAILLGIVYIARLLRPQG